MDLEKLLENVIGRNIGVPQLKIKSIKEYPCTEPGQNFMSVVNLVKVEGELPNGDPYTKSVFVKRPTSLTNYRPPISIDDAFANEVLMYRAVLPLMATAADVTRLAYPRCYHAASDVIVLEDLKAQGYGVSSAATGFDLATTRIIIKELAKFHAASFHTNVVQKEIFHRTTRGLKPLGLVVSSNKSLMETSLERTIRHLKGCGDLERVVTSLSKLRGSVSEELRKFRKPKDIAVLVHGDFWFNNIMTWENKEGFASEENQIRIVDLQACAILSPAVDFWLLLYTSISPSLLADNCANFIQLYSSTFLEVMNVQNTPVNDTPSASSLEEELTSKELYGLLTAMAYLPALYLKRELISEIAEASEEEKREVGFLDKYVSSEFVERLIEISRYCQRKGVL